jgi:hypothetical protein
MEIEFTCRTIIDISSPRLDEICKKFCLIFKVIICEYFKQVILSFAEWYIAHGSGEIKCGQCGGGGGFIWKTRHGKPTMIMTIFGAVILNQLQVQCKGCGHKMYITRQLLGMESRVRLPLHTIRRLGLIGALTTYRAASKIVGMFGVSLDKMSIWRSVQKLSEEIDFDLDPAECSHGEADGTGIPINGIEKRGKEMKVFVQLKKAGGVRIAGLSIGSYDGGWEKLFAPLMSTLKTFKNYLLVTDGDTSILKGLGDKVTVIFQRCLWHIPHQFKFCLWKDGVRHKSQEWVESLSALINISNIKSLQHDKQCVATIVREKLKQLDDLLLFCKAKRWRHCVSYLENAKPDMFTALSHRLNGKTTSHAERVMRTINMRANVGKWSPSGILNATKIRLAYYYNGFDVN